MRPSRSAAAGVALAALGAAACPEAPVPPGDPGDAEPGVADPAAARCLAAGYAIETVHEHGVPRYTLCRDPGSGRVCEAWALFRGTCRLGDPPSGPPEAEP